MRRENEGFLKLQCCSFAIAITIEQKAEENVKKASNYLAVGKDFRRLPSIDVVNRSILRSLKRKKITSACKLLDQASLRPSNDLDHAMSFYNYHNPETSPNGPQPKPSSTFQLEN